MKNVYIIVDDGPKPWSSLLFDTLKLLKVKALFRYNGAANDIVSYQIKHSGNFLVTLDEFYEYTNDDIENIIIIIVTVATKNKTISSGMKLLETIPELKKEHNFPNWDKIKKEKRKTWL
jgi:hypothetical protein